MSIPYALASNETLYDLMENYYESSGSSIHVPEDLYYAALFLAHSVSNNSHLPCDMNTMFYWKDKRVFCEHQSD